jgi:hypothetical protein
MQPLSDAQQRVVNELLATGVASVPFASIFGDALWLELCGEADRFECSDTVREAKASFAAGTRTTVQKNYIVRKYPRHAQVTAGDPWLRLAIEPRMLAIANAYYGMMARLNFFDLWYTMAGPASRDRRSAQNWHRDAEDQNILKGFLYFSDVTDGAGALEYVKCSRLGERNCHTSYAGISWRRSLEEFSRIPEADIVHCRGPRGTLLFCDAAGIHRGGFATDSSRTLATWGYTSAASLERRRFEVVGPVPPLDQAAAYSLGER